MIQHHLPPTFEEQVSDLRRRLLKEPPFVVGEWQAIQDESLPQSTTRELLNETVTLFVPNIPAVLQNRVRPNLPWAEDHFRERVSGEPLNPPPSSDWWPFKVKGHEEHLEDGQFSHTYPERLWPRMVNAGGKTNTGRQIFVPHVGLRFEYGDLEDVVDLLTHRPHTRQAFVPIWFPEDTGANWGQRVPCTIGYHLILRDNRLHCVYYIRSCDFLRHFRDDVYMAARLVQWVLHRLLNRAGAHGEFWAPVLPGTLTMHITSLHVFEADVHLLEKQVAEEEDDVWGV